MSLAQIRLKIFSEYLKRLSLNKTCYFSFQSLYYWNYEPGSFLLTKSGAASQFQVPTLCFYHICVCTELSSSLLLWLALQKTLILCLITAKCLSFCDSLYWEVSVWWAYHVQHSVMLNIMAFFHSICLQQCLEFLLRPVTVSNNTVY